MKSRVLKRPMFRMGGDVENTGIMDGMRQRYAKSDPQGVQPRREPMLFRPSMNDFLIQFGLDLASRSPGGNIFQTAAAAAKEPFAIMQAKKMREGEIESDREFKRELLETEMSGAKERAEIAAGIKSYDTYVDVGFKKYNDIVLAENFANFMTKTKPQIDSGFGSSQFAGFIEQDLTKENVKNRFIKNNAGKIGKVFFDLKQNRLLQLKRIDDKGNVDLVPTTIANIGDTEGTTMPVPTEEKGLGFEQTPYQKEIARRTDEALKKREEERRKKVLESLEGNTAFDEGI
jgi:hypothetical protein